MRAPHLTPPSELGAILAIWAHPDDGTYLAGGIMAAARDRGRRVVCVSATAGERGTGDPIAWPPERLGPVRRREAAAAMAILGVAEHHVLDHPDGGLTKDDRGAIERIGHLIDDVRPDAILTFGADGMTFHPDHVAVHHWVTEAWAARGRRGRLLHATATVEFLSRHRGQLEEWGVYMTDERPIGVPAHRLAVHLRLAGRELDRKLAALRAMASQAPGLDAPIADAYGALVCEESFVDAVDGDVPARPNRPAAPPRGPRLFGPVPSACG